MTMTPPNPDSPTPGERDEVAGLLTAHLVATLEPQRGRALAAFRLASAAPDTSITQGNPRPISRRTLWLWAGVPSLLAACLALVVTLQFLAGPPAQPRPILPDSDLAAAPARVDRIDLSRDVDGGVTFLDDHTPVRMIRHQTLSHIQWVDPRDNATYSVTKPVENVDYVQLQPY